MTTLSFLAKSWTHLGMSMRAANGPTLRLWLGRAGLFEKTVNGLCLRCLCFGLDVTRSSVASMECGVGGGAFEVHEGCSSTGLGSSQLPGGGERALFLITRTPEDRDLEVRGVPWSEKARVLFGARLVETSGCCSSPLSVASRSMVGLVGSSSVLMAGISSTFIIGFAS